MIETVDLELQRNASLTQEFAVQNSAGQALDITGNTFEMDVKYRGGDADPALVTAMVTILQPTVGIIQIYLAGSSFAAVPGTKEIVRLAYDLIMMRAGIPVPVARGTLSLVPGVS